LAWNYFNRCWINLLEEIDNNPTIKKNRANGLEGRARGFIEEHQF
jgi:hypothetical protein